MEDQRWDRAEKIVRPIDVLFAPGINDAACPGEIIQHNTLDTLVGVVQLQAQRVGKVRFRKHDFVGAYKTLPAKLADLILSIAVWFPLNWDASIFHPAAARL